MTVLTIYVTLVIRLPLFDSTKTDANGAAMGSVVFLIADTSVTNDSLKHLSTRDIVSYWGESRVASWRSPFPEGVPEKRFLAESESEAPTSPPPRPMAPTPPASLPSASPIHCPPNIPPQPPLASPDVLTPQYLQTATQLPQGYFARSPQKSGVDRINAEMGTCGDAAVHPKYVLSPGILSDDTMTAASLLDEDKLSGLAPQGSAEIGNFSPVICEPPEDIVPEGSAPWFSVVQDTTEPTSTFLPTPSEGFEYGTIPQISITLAKSSRGNSPLAPPSCDSDVTIRRPSVYVDTASATQATGVISGLSISPGFLDELSPSSRSAVLASSHPTTSTNTSSSGLSPFSRVSIVESPSTTATTPAQSAISEALKEALTSVPGSKQRKERPTIDTSCVGPGGQVKKYRNGSVPPVHVPVKLRNASLDLPRSHESEKFEPNPSMYSIAPSISPPHLKKSGDLRCPSSQTPASRQGLAPRTRAPSIRREPLEFDEAQICLDTANLGDQELATFLKDVDAALSAIVNGSPAVAADSRAFLAVPGATSRIVSRHQSRKPSSQQLRADLSATVRSHEKESAARTGFSLVATSHRSPHPDVIPSRAASPLSGHADINPRLFLSQVDMTPGSMPVSPSRSALSASAFPLPQRVSPQPSPRQELVEWISPSFGSSVSTQTREHLQLGRPGSYPGDANGNEKGR
ncbi:hypothetical protein J3R82DRAFT_10881 [Butyriboletus roseoflavus]|nr:hypothetical protein J3R82DRAFT_10881 [Butyriboletus roseoflavus]